ncbi:MAG: glycosyltransferase [Planctomycetota bacterium]|nr:glycosyltransferase [Planctomycetota bacterium]
MLTTDLKIGGTPTVVRELALRLSRERDVQVRVTCLDGWGPVADQIRAGGVDVTALNARGRSDVLVISRLVRLIRRERSDTVFSFLMHANVAAAIASVFCPHVRFIESIQTTQPKPRWHWVLQSLAHRAAERVVVPSPSVADIAQRWAGVPEEKIEVVPNAIELSDYANWPARDSGGRRVGFIGRLDPIKRIGDLIDAVALLPADISLDVYGEGSERAKLEAQIARLWLGHRVKLHGGIVDSREALKSIDVLVLPSAAEGFGLVLIEAMAAGVPVVATDVPGIRDVVRNNETGLLVSAFDPGALAGAITRVIDDPGLRARLVASGLENVQERFSWDVVLPLYQTLLGLKA